MICFGHADLYHLLKNVVSFDEVKRSPDCLKLSAMERQWQIWHFMPFKCTFQPAVFFQGRLCDASRSLDGNIDRPSATADIRDNRPVNGNTGREPLAVRGGGYFLSVREIRECYLTSRYPPIFLKWCRSQARNGRVLICDPDWQAQLICASVLGWVTAWLRDLAAGS